MNFVNAPQRTKSSANTSIDRWLFSEWCDLTFVKNIFCKKGIHPLIDDSAQVQKLHMQDGGGGAVPAVKRSGGRTRWELLWLGVVEFYR